jgi:magnesium transporter
VAHLVGETTSIHMVPIHDFTHQFCTDNPDTWMDIDGAPKALDGIGEKFNIHPLVLEDILNTETRPKVEITDSYIFITMKMLTNNNSENQIVTEQVSLILGDTFVFSFLEKSDSVFNPRKSIFSIPADST